MHLDLLFIFSPIHWLLDLWYWFMIKRKACPFYLVLPAHWHHLFYMHISDTYIGKVIFALSSTFIIVRNVNETQNDSARSVTILVDLKQLFRKFGNFFSISTNPNPRHMLLHDVTAYGVYTHTSECRVSRVHVCVWFSVTCTGSLYPKLHCA
jgi:hypothetical protein